MQSDEFESERSERTVPRELRPMDPQLTSIQPGGGIIIHVEQAWGHVRRAWLQMFRRGYVRRMADCRKGEFNPCPHPVLDPRDLKFYQNQGGYYWDKADDPFAWRDRLPFARVGLAELFLIGGGFITLAVVLGWVASAQQGWLQTGMIAAAVAALIIFSLIVWFFRNPSRIIPAGVGEVVSPADGKIVEIENIAWDEFIGGPAVKIGIFLSIFNVHINRSPVAARVTGLIYRPGKYLNALRPESARENEQLAILLETTDGRFRGMIVRQITGAIARRIVCWLKPGDSVDRGQQFGMIKFGSRTELLMPAEAGLAIQTRLGDHVQAGSTVLARYADSTLNDEF